MKIAQQSLASASLSLAMLFSPAFSFATPPSEASAPASPPTPRELPAPKTQVSLALSELGVEWEVANRMNMDGVRIMEFVPSGQKSSDWNLMLVQMFSPLAEVEPFAYEFSERVKAALGTKPQVTIEALESGGVVVDYRAADEQGVWKFLSSPDGVYAAALIHRGALPPVEDWRAKRNVVKTATLAGQ